MLNPTISLYVLDRVAVNVRKAQMEAALAGSLIDRDPDHARDLTGEAKKSCGVAISALHAMGVTIPDPNGSTRPGPAIPLELLNTPAVHRLLTALEAAAEAAAEVDRERGWMQDGEPCGWAEQIANMTLGLRMDAFGPAGRE